MQNLKKQIASRLILKSYKTLSVGEKKIFTSRKISKCSALSPVILIKIMKYKGFHNKRNALNCLFKAYKSLKALKALQNGNLTKARILKESSDRINFLLSPAGEEKRRQNWSKMPSFKKRLSNNKKVTFLNFFKKIFA